MKVKSLVIIDNYVMVNLYLNFAHTAHHALRIIYLLNIYYFGLNFYSPKNNYFNYDMSLI